MDWKSITLILYLVTLVLSGRDFYKILGVDKSTSKKDIKRAYRKLAMKFHPDKNPDNPEAADKFKEIGDAYETLADDDKRATYNKHGEEGVKKMGQGGGHDPFANFFGHGFGFGGQEQEQREHRGADVNVDLFVTLEELYLGSFVTITRNKPVYKESGGTRQCNCRMEMKTHMTGPGSFQVQLVTDDNACRSIHVWIKYLSTFYHHILSQVIVLKKLGLRCCNTMPQVELNRFH